MFYPFLFFILGIIILITTIMRFRGKGYGKDFEAYISEEKEANSVKNRPIGDDEFLVLDLSVFPIKEEEGNSPALLKQREVTRLAAKKMMRLESPMTNTELKHKFGTVNLEKITEYEENFYRFIYAVNNWAEALLKSGDEEDAVAVLEGGVHCGAETSKTYTLLADIYLKRNQSDKLRQLVDMVQGRNMPAKEKTLLHINGCLSKLDS